MSEKLGSSFEEFRESEDSGVSSLEEMANQFDPKKAEKQKALEEQETSKEKVLSSGEVSELLEDKNGNAKLESKYMDAVSRYEQSANYDKNDHELKKAIWGIGMSAALLDVDKDVIDGLQNGDSDLFKAMEKDERVLYVFDKACEDMGKIANSGNKVAAEEAIEFIKSTGKVGEIIAEEYKDWQEAKTA